MAYSLTEIIQDLKDFYDFKWGVLYHSLKYFVLVTWNFFKVSEGNIY